MFGVFMWVVLQGVRQGFGATFLATTAETLNPQPGTLAAPGCSAANMRKPDFRFWILCRVQKHKTHACRCKEVRASKVLCPNRSFKKAVNQGGQDFDPNFRKHRRRRQKPCRSPAGLTRHTFQHRGLSRRSGVTVGPWDLQ